MADRHLARAKAVETYLVLEVDKTSVRLGIEIRCGNADLEFVLQALSEGFGDLHGFNLLPMVPAQRRDVVIVVDARQEPASVVRRDPIHRGRLAPREIGSSSIVVQTLSALGAGGGTRTPTTFVTGT